jgi:hypothetical protein
MRRALAVVVLIVAAMVPARTATAASITFDSQTLTLGSCQTTDCSFSVDLLAQDFDPFIGLLLNYTFDPAILSLTSVVQGAFLAPGGQAGFDSRPLPGAGFQTITMFVDPSAAALMGSGILATLNFTPLAAGNAALSLLASGLLDDGSVVNTEYFTEDFQTLSPTLTSGVVTIQSPQPVPEPSTLALLGIGLAAMARKRLKRQTLG